jgi:hypothetical protein
MSGGVGEKRAASALVLLAVVALTGEDSEGSEDSEDSEDSSRHLAAARPPLARPAIACHCGVLVAGFRPRNT